MKIEKRVAIVTGGARGIGYATAVSLAAHGVVPVIADINIETAEKSADWFRQSGSDAFALKVDLGNTDEITGMIDAVVARYGRLDILVNNAGILTNTQYDSVTGQEWDRMMNINLKGVFFASREAIRPMKAQGWGRIISISSMAGRSGGISAGSAYVAAKAAIIGITRHLAKKVAADGITVNAVAPGTIESDMLKDFTQADLEAIYKTIPMGRLGKPEEIAETIAFLASDAAAFMTGAILDVNGGNYMA